MPIQSRNKKIVEHKKITINYIFTISFIWFLETRFFEAQEGLELTMYQ